MFFSHVQVLENSSSEFELEFIFSRFEYRLHRVNKMRRFRLRVISFASQYKPAKYLQFNYSFIFRMSPLKEIIFLN